MIGRCKAKRELARVVEFLVLPTWTCVLGQSIVGRRGRACVCVDYLWSGVTRAPPSPLPCVEATRCPRCRHSF